MSFKTKPFHLLLLAFCAFLSCVFTLEVNMKLSNVHLDHVDVSKVDKKSDNIIEIPLDKPKNSLGKVENQGSVSTKVNSQLLMEGGGIIDLSSTAQPNDSLMEIATVDDDTNHSKGSKPRKGVQHPGSSVVPRKGVDPHETLNVNQSSVSETSGSIKESTNINSDSKIPLNKTQPSKVEEAQQLHEKSSLKVSHPKKPVVVTDIEDVDDFEKYPIIQTSTTGEDYIIIGIVIVLGIWCSIFGALIFYRRAGEYWDRRHYRRMDFLVEGMYND